jgi:hypothetical protein
LKRRRLDGYLAGGVCMLTASPQKSARGVCGLVPDYQALITWDEAERKRRQTSP